MNIREMRKQTGLSQAKFGALLHIPYRTLQDWEYGKSHCPDYVTELIEYKLKNEKLI
jgi:putative transcriptional regulator